MNISCLLLWGIARVGWVRLQWQGYSYTKKRISYLSYRVHVNQIIGDCSAKNSMRTSSPIADIIPSGGWVSIWARRFAHSRYSTTTPTTSCSALKILFSILQRTYDGKYDALDVIDRLV